MATRAVLGGEIVWHSEYEPPTEKNPRPTQAAARILAHRFPGVPNHGDITAIDWADVEPVDVLTGGFPCQVAFGDSYRVLGNRRERVRQLGNAVTPPAAEFLLSAVTAALDGAA